MTEKRLAAACDALDSIESTRGFRGPKIGGCDFSEAASGQCYIKKIVSHNLRATTETRPSSQLPSSQLIAAQLVAACSLPSLCSLYTVYIFDICEALHSKASTCYRWCNRIVTEL
jgi:hypothetical protein